MKRGGGWVGSVRCERLIVAPGNRGAPTLATVEAMPLAGHKQLSERLPGALCTVARKNLGITRWWPVVQEGGTGPKERRRPRGMKNSKRLWLKEGSYPARRLEQS